MLYRVSYTDRVKQHLRELLARNPARRTELERALAELDRILRVYPQFGQPLSDLSIPGGQHWVVTVAPFVVHYGLFEADNYGRPRRVFVGRLFALLPNSGLV